jgi:[ribosomal protein S18]-alanine N-acetyltransferase
VGEPPGPGDPETPAPPAGPAEVRPATRDDLVRVVETERACFSTPWSRSTFEALLGRNTVCFRVLEVGGEVMGHAVLWWVGPEAEVANVAVAPLYRGRGGGARLLDALLAEAAIRGVERVFLEVRESNRDARALYDGRGFVPVGRRPRYYQKPTEDAVVMELDLVAAREAGTV